MSLCFELVRWLAAVLVTGESTTWSLLCDVKLLLFEEHAWDTVLAGGSDELYDATAHALISRPTHRILNSVVFLVEALSHWAGGSAIVGVRHWLHFLQASVMVDPRRVDVERILVQCKGSTEIDGRYLSLRRPHSSDGVQVLLTNILVVSWFDFRVWLTRSLQVWPVCTLLILDGLASLYTGDTQSLCVTRFHLVIYFGRISDVDILIFLIIEQVFWRTKMLSVDLRVLLSGFVVGTIGLIRLSITSTRV